MKNFLLWLFFSTFALAQNLPWTGSGNSAWLKQSPNALVLPKAGNYIKLSGQTNQLSVAGGVLLLDGNPIGGGGVTIYTGDGTLPGDRFVDGDGHLMSFFGNGLFVAESANGSTLQGGTNLIAIAPAGIEFRTTGFPTATSGQILTLSGGLVDYQDVVGSVGGQTNWGLVVRDPSDGTAKNTGVTIADIASGSAISDGSITLAKMANLAQDQFIVRTTASTGVPQTATVTSFARTILDDTTAADVRTTIGAGTGSGDALTSNPLSQFAATTSAQLAGVLSDETGSGLAVFGTSPTLTTPNIGVATATTVNNLTITQPASAATLTIANNKTLTANNSITLSGTDSTTMVFPTTGATIARTDAGQTFTGTQTFSSSINAPGILAAGSGNVNIGSVTSGNFMNVGIVSGSIKLVEFDTSAVLIWGTGGTGGAMDTMIGRASSGNMRQGAPDDAAPVAQISSVQSVVAGTSNTAGVQRTITGSKSTGNASGGSIVFQTSPLGSSGTAQNALVTALTINGEGKTIANNTVRLKGYTVATLPAGTQGDTAFVTDALAPTFLATVVGGGAVVAPVFFDGTNWVGY